LGFFSLGLSSILEALGKVIFRAIFHRPVW
jgi:hypothetical protein